MALFFVSYDLRAPGRNYQALYDELERYKAKRVLESVWALKHSTAKASAFRDHFKKFIDANDRLLVAEVSDWAAVKPMIDINKL